MLNDHDSNIRQQEQTDESTTEEAELGLDKIFTEAPRPPSPQATFSTYQGSRKEFRIRLVGSHPLWGHHLWNSALAVASYLEQNQALCHNRNVLELGAGGALPSLVAVESCNALKVVITDYPDPDLVKNIEFNVRENVGDDKKDKVSVQGYIWGQPTHNLFKSLQHQGEDRKFDLIILSDLIFNHSQHDALLKTCRLALQPDQTPLQSDTSDEATTLTADSHPHQPLPHKSSVLVFYTHHRPHLAHRDMEFFEKAREEGWDCRKVVTQKFVPMFPEDPGEEEVRATVHGYILTRTSS
ncbi:putative methyltransferase-domain-containing protein [Lentinula raphanica]|nr:putative methyltransferase-domain-containing protein [Lentinula raphanica]